MGAREVISKTWSRCDEPVPKKCIPSDYYIYMHDRNGGFEIKHKDWPKNNSGTDVYVGDTLVFNSEKQHLVILSFENNGYVTKKELKND